LDSAKTVFGPKTAGVATLPQQAPGFWSLNFSVFILFCHRFFLATKYRPNRPNLKQFFSIKPFLFSFGQSVVLLSRGEYYKLLLCLFFFLLRCHCGLISFLFITVQTGQVMKAKDPRLEIFLGPVDGDTSLSDHLVSGRSSQALEEDNHASDAKVDGTEQSSHQEIGNKQSVVGPPASEEAKEGSAEGTAEVILGTSELKKKIGRPVGSKNRPKPSDPVDVSLGRFSSPLVVALASQPNFRRCR
jgi:hypothetical protein